MGDLVSDFTSFGPGGGPLYLSRLYLPGPGVSLAFSTAASTDRGISYLFTIGKMRSFTPDEFQDKALRQCTPCDDAPVRVGENGVFRGNIISAWACGDK